MRALALDLSSNTGWALSTPDQKPVPSLLEMQAGGKPPRPDSGVKVLGGTGASQGQRFAALRSWLADFCIVQRPRFIVYEAALPAHKGAKAARLALGLAATVECLAYERGIACYEANNATIKKHATGNGHADKQDMINKALSLGWDVIDDNHADALWLLDYFIATHIEPRRRRL